mmetsp:Transcript_21214/g.47118  ORF Transcript_21214/g.47118 Transcript_21214/m.47118 type:complete len:203 (-) Transcript_21214:212-820(-)
MYSCGSTRLQATAMLIAVSSLSPVSTHTLTPACTIISMAWGTPSCSLSSMAVAPTMSKSCSISSSNDSIRFGSPFLRLSSSARSVLALAYLLAQARYLPASTCATATTKHLSPSLENWFMSASVLARRGAGALGDRRVYIMESAPLHTTFTCPSRSRMTTDMRLRAEEKGIVCSTSTRISSPVEISSMMQNLSCLSRNWYMK